MGASSSASTSMLSNTTSSKKKSVMDRTLTGVGNLIKLLPTGTVFLFQFLNPVLTNTGQCAKPINKYLSAIFIFLSAFSCCFASFTDSYTGSDAKTHYGIATKKGLWPSSDNSKDLSGYKLRFGDFVHAFFALVVFGVVSLLDTNTVNCFYPEFESSEKVLLQVLPPVIGAVAGTVFVVFPNTRHGIGYPSSSSDDDSNSQDS